MFLVPMTRHASDLTRSFDRLFDDGFIERFFGAQPPGDAPPVARSPALDVAESDKAYTVKLDLPGVAKDQVKITIDGRRVGIEAEASHDEEKKEGERVVYRERSVSRFARSFTLPLEVDQSASQAQLEQGVLTLTLAKRNGKAAAQLSVK